MRPINRLLGGVRALFRRGAVERELDTEIRGYLDASIDERVRAGWSREDATRAARAEMGSIAAVKDHTRDVGWEASLDSLWRDFRYSARTLRKSPAFSIVAILTLALGIGANSAIFSIVNGVMLRPLPVPRPGELISLTTVYPNMSEPIFSYAAYQRFAADCRIDRWHRRSVVGPPRRAGARRNARARRLQVGVGKLLHDAGGALRRSAARFCRPTTGCRPATGWRC